MKKLLAFVLCVAMIASMCVFSTSAATYWSKVQGKGVYWSSATAYGWISDDAVSGLSADNWGIEFDVVYLADGDTNPAAFGLNTSAGIIGISRTGVGVGDPQKAEAITGYSPITTAVAAGPTCQQHVKAEVTSSGITVWVDGNQVFTQGGVTLNQTQWFFAYVGAEAVDNFKTYNPSTGATVKSSNFDNGSYSDIFSAGTDGTIDFDDTYDVYGFMPGDKVIMPSVNQALTPDEDFDVKDVAIEYDIAYVGDDDNGISGACFDTTSGRLSVTRYGVGLVSIYSDSATMQANVNALPTVAAASWTNQHHVKYTSTSDGVKVYVDGNLIYQNSEVFAKHWVNDHDINLGTFTGTTALKNIRLYVVSSNKTLLYSDGSTTLDGKIGNSGYGGSRTIDTVPDYLVTYPTFSTITGYTQMSYDGDLADTATYSFDLALIPNENGESRFTAWAETDGTIDRIFIALDASTGKASVGVACDGTHSSTLADAATFDWGAGTYANTHKVVITIDNGVKVNIDGSDVYTTSGVTAAKGWAIMMPSAGTSALDNFTFKSGSVTIANDFEDNTNGVGGTLKTIYPCGSTHTYSSYYKVTKAATCTEAGSSEAVCEICGDSTVTNTIAATGHSFVNNWDDPTSVKDATATEAGSRSYKCKNCDVRISTTTPATNDYTGSYKLFVDLKDTALADDVVDFPAGATLKDGQYTITSNDTTYFQVGKEDNLNPTAGYVQSVDIRLNNIIDGDKYGSTFYFWFGGDNQMAVQAGIDFANGVAFIRPSSSGVFKEITAEVDVNPGEWHTLALRFVTDWEDWTATAELLLDGEVVVTANDDNIDDAVMVIGNAEDSTSQYAIMRLFGASVSLANYVQGSYDFTWTNGAELAGDINGDGKVNMLDLLRAKKYVAGLVDASSIVAGNADLDLHRDGLTSSDIVLLKKLISTL
jgi:hypothetical protein